MITDWGKPIDASSLFTSRKEAFQCILVQFFQIKGSEYSTMELTDEDLTMVSINLQAILCVNN